MVCDFRLRRPTSVPAARQVGDPARPTSIISLGPDHHRFSFMLDSENDFEAERAPEKVWDRVARHLTPDDAELIRVATYTFRSRIAHRWRSGRVLLAGDAAHQMPPFLGQGMCSGIRDAQNLAFKTDRVLRGIAPMELLDTYQAEREPHVRTVTEMGITLGRLQTTRDPATAAARDRELRAERAAGRKQETIRFPALTCGLLAARSLDGRGELSWQGVLDDGSSRGRFDQIVGAGFAFLASPEVIAGLGPLAQELAHAGVNVAAISADGPLADVEGTYARWFAEKGWSAVAVRPDFYVYGAAGGPLDPRTLAQDLLRALGQPTATPSPARAVL
jgi:3-(3-hydroxy-phenyl)propionate hydroxylase/flavoprotein hydroxylase